MTKLIVICGATATGKSSLALALAMRFGSVIISADSRQVYRKFDIGTAKPTVAEQKLVPHYLIEYLRSHRHDDSSRLPGTNTSVNCFC